MKRCPACGSTKVRRSNIRTEERGAHGFRSPYRCEDCRERYWVLSHRARVGFLTAAGSVAMMALLLTGVAVLVRLLPKPEPPAPTRYSEAVGQVIVPLSRIPDQVANETRRLESRATEPLPPVEEP